MKNFPILYKRTRTGAIQYWSISLENESDSCTVITKESGQLGTDSPVRHQDWVQSGVNIGKSNETTPAQQAELQAESDWKRKKDSGYKTLEGLKIEQKRDLDYHFEGDVYKLKDALELALPEFNSDAQGNVKPMLAKDWNKVKNIQYPCIIEPKLDGVRCLMVVTIDQGIDVIFLSRSGKEYMTLNHIGGDIFAAWYPKGSISSSFILDGEIYSDELTFQEITAAVKKQSPNSLKLHFRAYDLVNEETQAIRRTQLSDLTRAIGSDYVKMIGYTIANDSKAVKHFHDEFVQEGNEGAILRMFKGKYEQGFRSSSLLKVKEFDETEYPLKAWDQGQRGIEDLLVQCTTKDGKVFKAKVQGTEAQKVALYESYRSSTNPLKVTIKHFGLTTDGLPRFPIAKAIRDYE